MVHSWDVQAQNGLQHEKYVNLLTVNYAFDKFMGSWQF